MALYCIIETEDGLNIVEHSEGMTAEETAHRSGGTVVDSGPYHDYEDACEALVALEQEIADDDGSDVPGTQAMESRPETAE
jgi:hypothetical protein